MIMYLRTYYVILYYVTVNIGNSVNVGNNSASGQCMSNAGDSGGTRHF